MHIYAVQPNIIWQDREANYQKVQQLITTTSIIPGGLIVLPEMFATGFSMNTDLTAEASAGPSCSFLSTLAHSTQCWIVGGLVTQQPYNNAIVFSPDGHQVESYAKRHLFSYAGEENHYRPGTHLQTFSVGPWTCSLHICYDLRFPEDFREVIGRGAELLIVIANWPSVRQDHWTCLLAARAIENQAYVLGVNRCGSDPTQAYAGGTRLLDPKGRIVGMLDDHEGVLHTEPARSVLLAYRKEFPTLKDMLS